MVNLCPHSSQEKLMVGASITIESLLQRVATLEAELASHKRAEARLRRIGRQWRRLLDRATEGFWAIDGEGTTVFVNRAMAEMLGHSVEEMEGEPFRAFIDDDAWLPFVEATAEGCRQGAGPRRELRFRHGDGTERWARVSVSPELDRRGRFAGTLGVVADATEQKLAEEQLLRSQRLETAGRIAAQVAHDFNNLLSPLIGYPDLIRRQLPAGHQALAYCEDMQEAALQMADINQDMLALGRRGRLSPQPADLNRLVRQAIDQMPAPARSLKVDLDLDAGLLPVGGAPAQLLRAIANLVANGREAMQDRGRLTLRTDNVYLDEPTGGAGPIEVGEYAKLTVRDTGCGIPREVRGRIFDAFFTTKTNGERRGCGLGLSVVRAVVEDHGGFIDLESEVGKGTTFTLYLPASRDLPEERSGEEPPRGTETILVVDDDRLQREIVRELLGALGYRVEVAPSGEAATARLRGQRVELLILDMVMPQGMDGLESYRRALEARPGQRALLLSGYAEAERVREAQKMGAGAFLSKPVTLERLAWAVRRELDRG